MYKPSSVFVQYAYREYRIHWLSSPVVAVFFCETGLNAGQPVSLPVNVDWSPHIGRADVEVIIVVLHAHNI